jgi:hypothetical protein
MFLLARFKFVFILLLMYRPDPLPNTLKTPKGVQASGKLIQDNTKSFVINIIGPYL